MKPLMTPPFWSSSVVGNRDSRCYFKACTKQQDLGIESIQSRTWVYFLRQNQDFKVASPVACGEHAYLLLVLISALGESEKAWCGQSPLTTGRTNGLGYPKTATVIDLLYPDSSLSCASVHILSCVGTHARVKPSQIPVPG